MRMTLSTNLVCDPGRVWSELKKSRSWLYVSYPMVTFTPVDPQGLPEMWSEDSYRVKMKFLGIIPMGVQTVVATDMQTEETPGKQRYSIRDAGYGDLTTKWDHIITLTENSDGTTHYTDSVEVEAGWMTFGVWLFASVFYRYRQMRWRKWARRCAATV